MNEKGFRGVVGHEDVIGALQNAIRTGRVSHAYLFTGEPGSGKRFIATTYAAALQCEKGGVEPCMECRSCRKALSRNHPDIIELTHEKADLISVGEVREQLVDGMYIKPYESRYKIYIVNDAEKMNPQAQNALLKTLEEPPEYGILMLLANRPEALLPTIRSRCVEVALRTVRDSQIRDFLTGEMNMDDADAGVAAAFAQGNVGRAKAIAGDETFSKMATTALRLVDRAQDLGVRGMMELADAIAPEKADTLAFLDILLLWFRDVLLYKATKDPDNIVFTQELSKIREQAVHMSYEDLENVIDAVEKATTRLYSNVARELTLELLFMAVLEATR